MSKKTANERLRAEVERLKLQMAELKKVLGLYIRRQGGSVAATAGEIRDALSRGNEAHRKRRRQLHPRKTEAKP